MPLYDMLKGLSITCIRILIRSYIYVHHWAFSQIWLYQLTTLRSAGHYPKGTTTKGIAPIYTQQHWYILGLLEKLWV